MTILINNAVESTQIFLVLFILALLLTLKKKEKLDGLSINVTQELKGFAILAIVFSHIGYFLVSDTRFLFPLSVAAGVGVNLFLFLSGYGIVTSSLLKPLSILEFYKRRLIKLYIPFWLTFFLFLALDYFILARTYSFTYIWHSLIGHFQSANSFDINSPFWYFTFIVGYYLLFPLVFIRKKPWVTAIILYFIGFFLIRWNPSFLSEVMRLYQVHILAFPLGVLAGSLVFQYKESNLMNKFETWKKNINMPVIVKKVGYCLISIFLLCLFAYTAYYSHVGDKPWIEEIVSIITGGALTILFVIKKVESRFLYWFGIYSYEIYLLHWPILSRFDIFYSNSPAWLATVLYLIVFMAMAWAMRILLDIKIKRKNQSLTS